MNLSGLRTHRISILCCVLFFLLLSSLYFGWIDIKPIAIRINKLTAPVTCSENISPATKKWFIDSIREVDATSGQWAEINHGKVETCQYGWTHWPFVSSKINENSIFAYASLTKLVTAELVFQSIRLHKISLQDLLTVQLLSKTDMAKPWADKRAKNIHIENLLSHRFGVDRTIQGDVMGVPNSWCPNRVERGVLALKLDSNPGQRFAYSNLGYCLLGTVVERSAQKPFVDLVEQSAMAKWHFRFLWEKQMNDAINWVIYPTGIHATNDDLRIWHHAQASGSIKGSARNLVAMLNESIRKPIPNILSTPPALLSQCKVQNLRGCHGLAMYRFQFKHHDLFWKDGSMPNVTAIALIDGSKQKIMVFLANGGQVQESKVVNERLLGQYLQAVTKF